MATKKKAEEPNRTIIVQTMSRVYKVQIPGGARCVIGPVLPPMHQKNQGLGMSQFEMGVNNGTALRIYSGANKENQLAMFRNVVAFRDVDKVSVYELDSDLLDAVASISEGIGGAKVSMKKDASKVFDDIDIAGASWSKKHN